VVAPRVEPYRRRAVLLADAEVAGVVRRSLVSGGVEVRGECGRAAELFAALTLYDAELVVIDLPRAPSVMADVVAHVRRRFPSVEIHVVMHGEEPEVARLAEQAGADLVLQLEGADVVRLDSHRRAIARRVYRALEGDEISAVYQPVVNLRTGRVVGLEAFARFGDLNERTTAAWFRDAETVGLRRELELATLAVAMESLGLVPDGWFVAVNLSPATLCSGEFAKVAAGLPLGKLWLEVSLRDEPAAWFEHLGDLFHDYGQRPQMVLDDAGGSYASLRSVYALQPDVVKVAPELVRELDHRPDQRAAVSTLAVFAKETGAVLVAEGVENVDEGRTLVELGVRLAQGYLFARPDVLTKAWVRELRRR
jgi:EAL domain-containing protein (putative c-di-GMP-specific phosphodiesterase class I)